MHVNPVFTVHFGKEVAAPTSLPSSDLLETLQTDDANAMGQLHWSVPYQTAAGARILRPTCFDSPSSFNTFFYDDLNGVPQTLKFNVTAGINADGTKRPSTIGR